MKRFFLISETNEIQTELLAAYQKATSKIQMPTVGEAMAINGGNKIIDINSKKKALH